MTEIAGTTAFVTGAAGGIGLGIAGALAKRGANVVLGDLDEGQLEAAAAAITEKAPDAGVRTIVCDVRDPQALIEAAALTQSAFGAAHLLVNNAGVSVAGTPGELPIEDYRWIVDINLMGVIHGVEAFVPLLRESGRRGHIVNVASMAGHFATPGMAPYYATKFAVVGYSEAIALDFASADADIGVTVLCPGWVRTGIVQSLGARPSGKGSTETDQAKEIAAALDAAMTPDAVGAWTVECIEANRLHAFTHPIARRAVQARFDGIMADFDASEAADVLR